MYRTIKSYLSLPLILLGLGACSTGGEIIQTTSNIDIKGTLLLPDSSGVVPVVLIISGSGPTDRDGNQNSLQSNSLKLLATELEKANIASVRYDKRGVGASRPLLGLSEKDLTFENYITDAKGWIEILAQDDRFSEVIVIGHSEGALIGMVAAINSGTSKFISLAGPGNNLSEIILEQLSGHSKELHELSVPIVEKLLKGEITDPVDPSLRSIFRPSVQPFLISMFKYNPVDEIKKLEIPVLVIQGTTDIQVPVSDAKLLAEASSEIEIVIIEEMNHVLKRSVSNRSKNLATYNMPELANHPTLVQGILKFISDG